MGYKYIRQFDEFYLCDDQTGNVINHRGKKVLGILVFVYEDGTFSLYKHGEYDMIKAIYEKTRKVYTDRGALAEADSMRLIRVEHCLLEDLNKILSTSALPVKFLDRLEVIDITPVSGQPEPFSLPPT